MAIDLSKAGQDLIQATVAPPKSTILFDKMNTAIVFALRATSGAAGEFALDAITDTVEDEDAAKAINLLASQTAQEIHSLLLAKAITNAMIEYLRENVTTELTSTELAPAVHGAPQKHVIKPIKLVVP